MRTFIGMKWIAKEAYMNRVDLHSNAQASRQGEHLVLDQPGQRAQRKTVPNRPPVAWASRALADKSEREPLPDETQPNPLLDRGSEDVGPAMDALNGISLAQLSLSTSKFLRKEHRASFTLRLCHVLHIFIQTHDAVVVIPKSSFPPQSLVLNLWWTTKLLHITLALLQPSGNR